VLCNDSCVSSSPSRVGWAATAGVVLGVVGVNMFAVWYPCGGAINCADATPFVGWLFLELFVALPVAVGLGLVAAFLAKTTARRRRLKDNANSNVRVP